ncbi:transcriptional regulator [Methylobacterium sp. DM1]|nr:transcriptional regulator [Methylobacterium sp. DM1]
MDIPSTRPKRATEQDRIVGLRIQTLRKAKGMSQGELGKAVGVSFQQIQKYENSTNRVGAGRLSKIAEVLRVPVSNFFDGADCDAGLEETELFILLSIQGAIDLLRAFNALEDDQKRREVVTLMDRVARLEQELGT